MQAKKLSLILVEYPDGKVAVQALDYPRQEAEEMFNECKSPSSDVRMSLIHLDLCDQEIVVSGRVKIAKKSSGRI